MVMFALSFLIRMGAVNNYLDYNTIKLLEDIGKHIYYAPSRDRINKTMPHHSKLPEDGKIAHNCYFSD